MTTDRAISVLNDLIETSKDGEKGFRKCAEDTSSPDLRQVFLEAASHCQTSAQELQDEVAALGGSPEEGGSVSGAIHRGWIDLKSSIKPRDNLAILEECERGEDFAKHRYEEALSKDMPDTARTIVQRQHRGVIANHDRIRDLRNSYR
ncbi:MAG TPA: PA2169 family four-helix-bundle protein [Rhodocyclaceae bacterium]|nr:PA2169 family four-helix-bundle protein [Rhodocyclaceae bacterium]